VWNGFNWFRGPVVGCSEHGNELAGFMEGGKLCDKLKDSAPWSWSEKYHCTSVYSNKNS